MARRAATDAPPQGLNHSYYNPEEPLDSNSQESSHSSRRSKPEKSRRNRSPGDGKMPFGYKRPYDPYYDDYRPKEPRRRDDDRQSRGHRRASEPRVSRHKSSHREPSPERYRHSRPASPDPKYKSSRNNTTDDRDRDHHSSRRSRGATAYASNDERGRRHRSQPREADDGYDRNRGKSKNNDKARSRDQDQSHDHDRGGHLRRRNTMPEEKPKKSSFWSNPAVKGLAGSVLLAGTQAYMQHREGKGSWLGAKGAGAAVTTIGNVLTDHLNREKEKKKKKRG
ncbi:hypothetical protein ACQKWADRAFT_291433 [Trichoderma austrokoningii]